MSPKRRHSKTKGSGVKRLKHDVATVKEPENEDGTGDEPVVDPQDDPVVESDNDFDPVVEPEDEPGKKDEPVIDAWAVPVVESEDEDIPADSFEEASLEIDDESDNNDDQLTAAELLCKKTVNLWVRRTKPIDFAAHVDTVAKMPILSEQDTRDWWKSVKDIVVVPNEDLGLRQNGQFLVHYLFGICQLAGTVSQLDIYLGFDDKHHAPYMGLAHMLDTKVHGKPDLYTLVPWNSYDLSDRVSDTDEPVTTTMPLLEVLLSIVRRFDSMANVESEAICLLYQMYQCCLCFSPEWIYSCRRGLDNIRTAASDTKTVQYRTILEAIAEQCWMYQAFSDFNTIRIHEPQWCMDASRHGNILLCSNRTYAAVNRPLLVEAVHSLYSNDLLRIVPSMIRQCHDRIHKYEIGADDPWKYDVKTTTGLLPDLVRILHDYATPRALPSTRRRKDVWVYEIDTEKTLYRPNDNVTTDPEFEARFKNQWTMRVKLWNGMGQRCWAGRFRAALQWIVDDIVYELYRTEYTGALLTWLLETYPDLDFTSTTLRDALEGPRKRGSLENYGAHVAFRRQLYQYTVRSGKTGFYFEHSCVSTKPHSPGCRYLLFRHHQISLTDDMLQVLIQLNPQAYQKMLLVNILDHIVARYHSRMTWSWVDRLLFYLDEYMRGRTTLEINCLMWSVRFHAVFRGDRCEAKRLQEEIWVYPRRLGIRLYAAYQLQRKWDDWVRRTFNNNAFQQMAYADAPVMYDELRQWFVDCVRVQATYRAQQEEFARTAPEWRRLPLITPAKKSGIPYLPATDTTKPTLVLYFEHLFAYMPSTYGSIEHEYDKDKRAYGLALLEYADLVYVPYHVPVNETLPTPPDRDSPMSRTKIAELADTVDPAYGVHDVLPIWIRPGIRSFLKRVAPHFELVLYSSRSEHKVDTAMHGLDPNETLFPKSRRLYADHSDRDLSGAKLQDLGRSSSRVIVVSRHNTFDDSNVWIPCVAAVPGISPNDLKRNADGVPVYGPRTIDAPDDPEFERLWTVLEPLVHVKGDLRPVLSGLVPAKSVLPEALYW